MFVQYCVLIKLNNSKLRSMIGLRAKAGLGTCGEEFIV